MLHIARRVRNPRLHFEPQRTLSWSACEGEPQYHRKSGLLGPGSEHCWCDIPEIIDRLEMHIETAGRNSCADLDTTIHPNHRAAFAPPEDNLLFSVPLEYVSDVLHGGLQRQEDGRD